MGEEAAWMRVREVVRKCFDRVDEALSEHALSDPPNLLFLALAGRAGAVNARAERICDTLLGNYAPEFFKPFFAAVKPLPKPFDFTGLLRGKEYTVKVVSGEKAFNSSVRKTVEEASFRYVNPVILTVQGGYFEARTVGKAVWYSAPASWKMVAGAGSYNTFKRIVFEEAKTVRESVIAKIVAARKREKKEENYKRL